jgi:hypothetical protein
MDKNNITFLDVETKLFPTGRNGNQELFVKHNDKWRRVSGMTTGPVVQYFVEMSPQEDWEQRNIIDEKRNQNRS